MGLRVFGWVVFGVFCRFLWRVRNVGLDVMHSKDVNMGNPLLARGRDRLETSKRVKALQTSEASPTR